MVCSGQFVVFIIWFLPHVWDCCSTPLPPLDVSGTQGNSYGLVANLALLMASNRRFMPMVHDGKGYKSLGSGLVCSHSHRLKLGEDVCLYCVGPSPIGPITELFKLPCLVEEGMAFKVVEPEGCPARGRSMSALRGSWRFLSLMESRSPRCYWKPNPTPLSLWNWSNKTLKRLVLFIVKWCSAMDPPWGKC